MTSHGEPGGASGMWVCVRGWGEVSHQKLAHVQGGRDARALEERAGAAHEEEGGSWEVGLEVSGDQVSCSIMQMSLIFTGEEEEIRRRELRAVSGRWYVGGELIAYPNDLTKAPWFTKPIALGFFSFDPT